MAGPGGACKRATAGGPWYDAPMNNPILQNNLLHRLHRHRGSLVRFKCPLYWYDSGLTDQKGDRLCILFDASRTVPVGETAAATGTTSQFGAVALQVLIEGQQLWVWSVADDLEVLNSGR